MFFADSAEDFTYTSLGQNIVIPGVNDAVDLEKTREALTMLGEAHTSVISALHHFLDFYQITRDAAHSSMFLQFIVQGV